MKASCRDLEKALSGSDPSLAAAFELHAASCADCGRELTEWRLIAQAAPTLRRAWDSPELLPRIRQAIAEQSQREPSPEAVSPPAASRWRWLPAASIAALFLIATAGLWVFRNAGDRDPLSSHWRTTKDPLLTERAIDDVETAEKAYLVSIETLSQLAEPKLAGASTPILVNYREKLEVLDSAIAELKASIDQNRWNTHLRRELLAVYQEKQRTLQSLMKEVKS
ncbi:MAG TPA: hypothetical protein VGG65_07630 [Thermoanaerobaculia bacterium]